MLAELLADLRYRFRALFHRGAMEQDLDQELQAHLAFETEKRAHAGLPAEQAARQAKLEFGGVEQVKEQSRDVRGIGWFDVLSQDLRYAFRSLRRSPGFTAAVVLTLGLGIGANAAMFEVVDRLLFRAPPFLRDAGRVHLVYFTNDERGVPSTQSYIQYTRYLDLRQWTSDFDQLAAYSVRTMPVGTGTETREMSVATASASLWDFFDAPPVLGRYFSSAEDSVPVGASVAVLSYPYWQSRFGGRTDVLGQSLAVGKLSYTIIGVTPKNFSGIDDEGPPAVYIPITAYGATMRFGTAGASTYYTGYNWRWMDVYARRKPGVSVAAATADLSRAHALSWEKERTTRPITPSELAKPRALAGPVQRQAGPDRKASTTVAAWVGGVALIVLLIACANVANLLLARVTRRRREIALRLALGVSRMRLARQLLTESLLLAGIGAIAGLLLAFWGGAALAALFLPQGQQARSALDLRTLGFALLVTIACAVVIGLAPMLQSRNTDLVESLKAGVREGGARHSRLRTGLLLLQAALSVLLLVGAGLFVQSLRNVRALRLGYDVEPVLYVALEDRTTKLTDDEAVALRKRLLESAQTIPGVEIAAQGLTVPFWNTWTEDMFVPGIDSVSRLGDFTLQAGTAEYFATMGTRIMRGRGIEEQDRKNTAGVLVVSESMARTLWPGREALGQCVKLIADTMPCRTVVGVAEDIKQNQLVNDGGRHYYLPIEQYHPEGAGLFLRMKQGAAGQEGAVRRVLQALMPGDSYVTVNPMSDIIGPEMQSWRLGATMFVLFGGLALVLAAIGLYSVISYDVAQRTHELGVRIALGARMKDLVKLVVGGSIRVALLGIALGTVIALVAGHWLAPLLFAESPRDPVVFGAVILVLLGAALFASGIPALRAARVDPNVALRDE
jgi:predicted permease